MKSFTLQLNAAFLALTINATSVAFGDVVVNTPATQSVILTSTGAAPVTINGATLTGAGFAVSGETFPATLNPGEQATLYIQFNPLVVGSATGQLTITSNSSTKGTAAIGLSGTGFAAPVVAVAVTPTVVSTTTRGVQQFAASVTGSSDTTVTWTVSGNGCSGTVCGTISSTGLYTAPMSLPSPATVTITASSVSDPSKSASATVTIVPPAGKTFYLAPASAGGKDSNSGLSPSEPWLTPHHSLNCGDTIIAASSSDYLETQFRWGQWGTVTGTGHCVARLTCARFDTCKLTSNNGYGIWVTASHWMIDGFEVTASTGYAICFEAYPPTSSANIQDIVFANDIANGCWGDGFATVPYDGGQPFSSGVDYFVLVGDIAYNASQMTNACGSGVSIWKPVQTDNLPGTHIYVSQTFTWGNVDPETCNGGTNTDGEGVILDTFTAYNYTGQAALENNIALFNGGLGFEAWETGSAPVYMVNNTAASNHVDSTRPGLCAEIGGGTGTGLITNVQFSQNLVRSDSSATCKGFLPYAYMISHADSSDVLFNSFGYNALGRNVYGSGVTLGPNNIFGTDPMFANLPTSMPPAPNCSGYANVIACMAPLIAGLTPTSSSVPAGWGYQPPSSTPIYNPLYPQWLCSVDLPNGIVTPGCLSPPDSTPAARRAAML